jgi:hypothetical protein
MTLDRVRPTSRTLLAAAIAALTTVGLAACGGSDDPQSLTFVGSDKGITGPSSAETGKAEITFENEGKETSDLQLLRVEGDHSASEVVEALGAAQAGKPFPDWFFAAGGAGTTAAGDSQVITQVLEPGTYYGVSTADRPKPNELAAVEVTGDTSDDELEADSEIEAVDYGFKGSDLKAGENEILFTNAGAQPHHILASRFVGQATVADAEKFLKSSGRGGGQPPLIQKGSQDTAVVEGGESQLVTLNLKPGRYALYCFITDRQGGPPHVIKGMVDEVDVK